MQWGFCWVWGVRSGACLLLRKGQSPGKTLCAPRPAVGPLNRTGAKGQAKPWRNCWVAVKELNLSYYIGETLLLTIYTRYGNLIFKFLNSNPAGASGTDSSVARGSGSGAPCLQ